MNIQKIYRAIMVHDELERKVRTLIKVVPQMSVSLGDAPKPRIHKKTMKLTNREWELLLEKLEIDGKHVEQLGEDVAIMGDYEGTWSW